MERRLIGRRSGRLPDRQGHYRRSRLHRQAQRQHRRSAANSAGRRHRLPARAARCGRTSRPAPTGSPYRWTSVALDRTFRQELGLGRHEPARRGADIARRALGDALGGGGSSSLFLDARGAGGSWASGWSAALTARRGWTDFAGGQVSTSAAYGVDVAKTGVFGASDRLGFRIAQPLRIEGGGFAMMLPTAYNYETGQATNSLTHFSLAPKRPRDRRRIVLRWTARQGLVRRQSLRSPPARTFRGC